MKPGIYAHIANSYKQASGNCLTYMRRLPWILRPFFFPVALLYALVLLLISAVFYFLIILDKLGQFTDWVRKSILNAMSNQRYYLDESLMDFIFRPIFLVLLSPLFLASLIVPKMSSDPVEDFIAQETAGVLDGAGAFKVVNKIVWGAAKRLFSYVSNTSLLLMPITASIAIIYSIVLIVIGLLFAILIPLDWVSLLIESMRQHIARTAYRLQNKVDRNFGSFLFVPILLTLLVPVFLALLIVPKFTTQFDLGV